jgi:hypothetical protein
MQNTGLFGLGAGAVLGQVEYAGDANFITNNGKGVVEVMGSTREDPAIFGYAGANGSGARTIENSLGRSDNHAQLIIGSGKDAATFEIIGGLVNVNNYASGSVTINPGAMLALLTNDNGSSQPPGNSMSRPAKLTNAGECYLAGQLRVQANHAGFAGIENSGTLTIRGDQAGVERLPNSAGPGSMYETRFSAEILNLPGGLVQGVGALTYINRTENNEGRFLRIYNRGILAPGIAGGHGDESYGSLILKDVNVRFGAFILPPSPRGSQISNPIAATPPGPGTLKIGIGGPPNAPGRYDSLTLTGTGDCGQVEFIQGDGNALNIVPNAGFVPRGTYRIVTAASVVGTFDTLQYNGAPQVPYTVNYLPGGIEVTFR